MTKEDLIKREYQDLQTLRIKIKEIERRIETLKIRLSDLKNLYTITQSERNLKRISDREKSLKTIFQERENKIYQFIKENNQSTITELMENLNISRRKIEDILKKSKLFKLEVSYNQKGNPYLIKIKE